MIPVYKPYLPPNSLKYAHEALDSTWLSSHGIYIDKATEKLQELLHVKHVLLLNNGTSATHLVSKALNFKHPQITKLIVPNNVYVAAVNSFLFDRTLDLISVGSDINTWNYNLNLLDEAINEHSHMSTPEDLAVLIVHNIGNIINVPMLQAKYPNVVFVEDNCEGFLGMYSDVYSGTESLASSISFFGNKNITSGEGGAVLTNDSDVYQYLKCVQGQGQSSVRFIHDELGYNYRMTNVQAAILYGQLMVLPEIQEKKDAIFSTYRAYLRTRDDAVAQHIEEGTVHANWMFGLRARNSAGYQHAEVYFKDKGIEIRPMFYTLSTHKHLRKENKILLQQENVSRILSRDCFILPSYPDLTQDEIKHILTTLRQYLEELNK